MISPHDFVTQCQIPGEAGATAADRLADLGLPAIDAIVHYLERTLRMAPAALLRVMVAVVERNEPAFLRLLTLTSHESGDVSRAAFLALGHLGDKRATTSIVEQLRAPDRGPVVCVDAAAALCMLRDPEARAPLRDLVAGWLSAGRGQAVERFLAMAAESTAFELMWPVTTISALAALGDHEFAPLAYEILSLPKKRLRSLTSGTTILSSLCVELRHFAGPGLLPACTAALTGANNDAKEILARIFGWIGTRDTLDLLVDLAAAKNGRVSEEAVYWFAAVTGADLPEAEGGRGDAVQSWWKNAKDRFATGMVYWGGEPWTADHLFERLGEYDEGQEGDEEVLIALGVHLGQERRRRKLSRRETIEACRTEAKSLRPGVTYRYGDAFDPAGRGKTV